MLFTPDPSALQAIPSHLATLFAVTPPAVVNPPPRIEVSPVPRKRVNITVHSPQLETRVPTVVPDGSGRASLRCPLESWWLAGVAGQLKASRVDAPWNAMGG